MIEGNLRPSSFTPGLGHDHLAGIVETNDRAEAALDAIVEDEARHLADRDWFVMYIEFVLYAARTPTFAKRFAAARRQLLTERVQAVRAAVGKWVESGSVDVERLVRTGHALTYVMALHNIVDRRSTAEADVAAGLRDLFTGALRRERAPVEPPVTRAHGGKARAQGRRNDGP